MTEGEYWEHYRPIAIDIDDAVAIFHAEE